MKCKNTLQSENKLHERLKDFYKENLLKQVYGLSRSFPLRYTNCCARVFRKNNSNQKP